jgi:hypothetical protein
MAERPTQSFADGLRTFFTKGALPTKNLRLTAPRAQALKDIFKEAIYHLPDCQCGVLDSDDCHCNDVYYEAMEWGYSQINKRFSLAELFQERGK